jgi:hypothetical protein
MDNAASSTRQKALALNLDATTYGTFAEMRRSLGTAVLWGAFGVTLFGIFLTPVFFDVVRWLSARGPGEAALAHELATPSSSRMRARWSSKCPLSEPGA